MEDVLTLRPCVKRQKKCRRSIDCLPDELLIVILSCLNFLEAARTSTLAHRWRYLWKHTTCCSIQFYYKGPCRIVVVEKFINSVNEVLKLHQGESIEQFKVGFLYPAVGGDIDSAVKWHGKVDSIIDGCIKFAMEKQVKVFELDLAAGDVVADHETTYNIPHVQKLLSISGEVTLLRTLTTLKSFRFINVRITQEVVEFLLSHCPLLEQVCISASCSLEGVKVPRSLTKLRSMEISKCDALKTIKIRAPNLVSFTYTGPAIRVPFKKVPLLSELTIGRDYAYSFIFKARKHSSYCRNLKKLKLQVSFQLWFCRGFKCLYLAENHSDDCDARETAATFSHKCLEVVKFTGFTGLSSDYTLALHLLRIASSLKKMILDSEGAFTRLIVQKLITKSAEKLKANLPPGAELLTLGPGFTRKLDGLPYRYKRER